MVSLDVRRKLLFTSNLNIDQMDKSFSSPPYSIVTSLPALLIVVSAVMKARAAMGDMWLSAASMSRSELDLSHLLTIAPRPSISKVDNEYYANIYASALRLSLDRAVRLFETALCHPFDSFLDRLFQYADVSPSVPLFALIYMDRFMANSKAVILNTRTAHRIYGVAFMLAAKFLEDEYYPQSHFATLIGISLDELNELEIIFLETLNHSLYVTEQDLQNAQTAFMAEAIDSPTGLSIFHQLYKLKIESLGVALDRTNTWNLHSPTPSSYGCTAAPNSYSLNANVTPKALIHLAHIQAAFDFPNANPSIAWIRDNYHAFSPTALRRIHTLACIIEGIAGDTKVPKMDCNSFSYLSYPIDNNATHNNNSGGSGSGRCQSSSQLSHAFEGCEMTHFDAFQPTYSQTWSSLDMFKNVDWRYNPTQTAFNVIPGGLFGTSSIWTPSTSAGFAAF